MKKSAKQNPRTKRSRKVATKSVSGEQTLPNGCQVQYTRTFYARDYRVTDYGPQDSSEPRTARLIEHRRRGAVSWGYVVDGMQSLLSGDVTRYGLGASARSPEVAHLMMCVHSLRELSDSQAWEVQVAGTNGGKYPTTGGYVYGAVLEAIRKADATLLAPLTACIKACKHSRATSAAQRMHDAVVSAAKTQPRPPTPYEIAVHYHGGEDRVPETWERSTFYGIMRKAGWGWLIAPRRATHPC